MIALRSNRHALSKNRLDGLQGHTGSRRPSPPSSPSARDAEAAPCSSGSGPHPAGTRRPGWFHALTKKVSFLKELSVDRWSLAGITNAWMRPYSQAVIGRPPFDTQRLSDETKALEIACLLRATLLELTDNAVYMAGWRCRALVRNVASRVQGKQSRHAGELRQELEQVRALL